MKQAQAYKRFQNLAKQSLSQIQRNIIVKRNNEYLVFDRYKIVKSNEGFAVYHYNIFVKTFISSQNAMSYCILDRQGKQLDSQQLEHLDNKLQQKMFDIEIAKHTINKTKDEDRAITAVIRMEDYILHCKYLKEQINHLVNLAKYFQEKELDNEVNRHRTKNRR
jgi:ABC-type uncharacterized transport system involved in gliding motility auxiliary subunit